MFDLNTRDYGDIAPLMKAIGGLLSAAWALYFGFRGRNENWEPPQQALSSALPRVAAVCISIALAYVWYQLTDPAGAAALVAFLGPAIGLTVATLLIYGFLLKVLVHDRRFQSGANTMSTEKVLGGFWKTKDARKAQRDSDVQLTAEQLIWGMENNPDLVWPKSSQGLAQATLNGFYVLFIFTGAGALTCAGAAIVAAQAPRIQEFTTSPARLAQGETAMIGWGVVNAKSVNLAPFGSVAAFGNQVHRPDKDTSYTLMATNSFATVGVQQSIEVTPAATGAAKKNATPKRPSPTTARPAGITAEARSCTLVSNVVIRGEGWLQNEHPGAATADCAVRLPQGGNYEIFVEYASQESRPVRVTLNSKIIAENGLAASTGGAGEMNLLEQSLGVHMARPGANTIQFYSEHPFPYIRQVRFRPAA